MEPKEAPRPEWFEVCIWRDVGSPSMTPDGAYWIVPEQ